MSQETLDKKIFNCYALLIDIQVIPVRTTDNNIIVNRYFLSIRSFDHSYRLK